MSIVARDAFCWLTIELAMCILKACEVSSAGAPSHMHTYGRMAYACHVHVPCAHAECTNDAHLQAHDLFLESLPRDEPIDAHDAPLTDTMGSIHRLQVEMRVPVVVEEYDDISSGQVQPKPTHLPTWRRREGWRASTTLAVRRSAGADGGHAS